MSFCGNCGKKATSSTAKFCEGCGSPFKGGATTGSSSSGSTTANKNNSSPGRNYEPNTAGRVTLENQWEVETKNDASRNAFNTKPHQQQQQQSQQSSSLTKNNNNKNVCYHCNKDIKGKYTELDNGFRYHQGACFVCGGCGFDFGIGESIFWSKSTKKIYCAQCKSTSNSLNCEAINARDYNN